MEVFGVLGEFWDKYYPVVLTILSAISAVSIAVGLLWMKVSPIVVKIKEWFDKDDDEKTNDISAQLQSVTLDTQITDLKAKIENPTISDTLKQSYITQLATLETLKAKLDAGLVTASTITDKYS